MMNSDTIIELSKKSLRRPRDGVQPRNAASDRAGRRTRALTPGGRRCPDKCHQGAAGGPSGARRLLPGSRNRPGSSPPPVAANIPPTLPLLAGKYCIDHCTGQRREKRATPSNAWGFRPNSFSNMSLRKAIYSSMGKGSQSIILTSFLYYRWRTCQRWQSRSQSALYLFPWRFPPSPSSWPRPSTHQVGPSPRVLPSAIASEPA